MSMLLPSTTTKYETWELTGRIIGRDPITESENDIEFPAFSLCFEVEALIVVPRIDIPSGYHIKYETDVGQLGGTFYVTKDGDRFPLPPHTLFYELVWSFSGTGHNVYPWYYDRIVNDGRGEISLSSTVEPI